MKNALLLVGILAALAWLSARLFAPTPAPAPAALRVVATFYPLAEFVRQIGGERVEVRTLVPPGTEPHDYEPTPQDILAAEQANIFIMNGGVDAWAERLVPDLRGGTVVVRAADIFPDANRDPHVWLDPVRAGKIVEAIRDALASTETGKAYAPEFAGNADRYLASLRALDAEYRSGLDRCETRSVFASHDAFGYLAKRYDLAVVPIAGLSPDEEPSPARMAEIADQARVAKVRYIFFEELVSPKLAETIAEEIGAATLVFNPLEGLTPDGLAAGKDYLSVMRENLASLRTALICR